MNELKAPTGSEIQGTSESILGTASVVFDPREPAGYDHDGNGTKMFWDSSTTKTIAEVPMFTDESGADWLLHHLIPIGAEPVQKDTLDAMVREELIGEALESMKRLKRDLDALGEKGLFPRGTWMMQELSMDLEPRHIQAKDKAARLLARDLERVPA